MVLGMAISHLKSSSAPPLGGGGGNAFTWLWLKWLQSGGVDENVLVVLNIWVGD